MKTIKKILEDSWKKIHHGIDLCIEDKEYGDTLASYGRLGYTPKREEIVKTGAFVYALTEEEKEIRNQALADIYKAVLKK